MERISVPREAAAVARAFFDAGTPLYLVGGVVRNTLLGQPYDDIDATGRASSMEAVALAKSAGARAFIRDERMGTVEITSHGVMVEYTPFRRENYAPGGGHRPEEVVFTRRMEEDALRRDFTVNALYADALTGEVSDPLGGLTDLKAKRLKSCRAPRETLSSDGVRIMRMVRFACQLGFTIDPALYKSAKANIRNLDDIAVERKREELLKILLSDARYPALTLGQTEPAQVRGLRMLLDLGVLRHLMPELMEGENMEQPGRYHRYTVLMHNLMVCGAVPPRIELRLAALLHDVAKPRCFALTAGKMHGHERVGALMAERMLIRLKMDRKRTEAICKLIEHHMFDLDGRAKETTCRKRFARWGFPFVEDLILLRRGDIIGSGMGGSLATAQRWERILCEMRREGAVDSMDRLAITGKEIMDAAGISPGPMVGRLKELLFERVAVEPSLNTRERLIREAANLSRGIMADGAGRRA